ncbi:MAG: Stp1/IreP family PP2C-type Ser/Thr phosphatase [Desulfobulbaceae bacterium]|nr:Stp1/IreP family PP2C-type Ser/Thr phosphatase [Desulfobulbaceae bacterium]
MKKQEGRISWGNYILSYSGISDTGQIRKENEDDFLVMEQHCLFCVADGMGGQEAGKLASQTTLESVAKGMNYLNGTEDATMPYGLTEDMLKKPLLANITQFSNSQVNKKSAGRTMGSTLVAAHFTENSLDISHVGDSRLYLWRKSQLTQLTEDHSLVYELFRLGKITQQEMHEHQMRNVITRAIGADTSVEPTLSHIEVSTSDIFLLCSDGLTNMLQSYEIVKTFEIESSLSSLAQSLITQANNAGGRDNITALLISVQQAT